MPPSPYIKIWRTEFGRTRGLYLESQMFNDVYRCEFSSFFSCGDTIPEIFPSLSDTFCNKRHLFQTQRSVYIILGILLKKKLFIVLTKGVYVFCHSQDKEKCEVLHRFIQFSAPAILLLASLTNYAHCPYIWQMTVNWITTYPSQYSQVSHPDVNLVFTKYEIGKLPNSPSHWWMFLYQNTQN